MVAGEVKSLAGQTGKATEQIAERIARVRATTEPAVQAADEIEASIRELQELAAGVRGQAGEQHETACGIVERICELSGRSETTRQSTAGLVRLADEASGSGGALRGKADTVQAESGRLGGEIEQLLAELRAAG